MNTYYWFAVGFSFLAAARAHNLLEFATIAGPVRTCADTVRSPLHAKSRDLPDGAIAKLRGADARLLHTAGSLTAFDLCGICVFIH